MPTRATETYDAGEMADNSAWSKALARYRKRGLSEQQIDTYRQAWQEGQKKKAAGPVNSLSSKSKK